MAFRAGIRSLSTATRSSLRIALIPGDGIGHEVIPAAKEAILALGSSIPKPEFIELDAGFGAFTRTGTALPHETEEALKKDCDCALFGAVSAPSRKVTGYSYPVATIRKELDLFANVRPVLSVTPGPNVKAPIDLVVVRENTECLYVNEEIVVLTEQGREARATRLISERASRRIGKVAFDVALGRARKQLSIVHKSSVLPVTDRLFHENVRAIPSHANGKYDAVTITEHLVDTAVYKLIREPEYFDVMVAPNLYGDILSHAAAALVGSFGLAPSVNLGDTFVMGQPVHGTVDDIAGENKANPIAAIRSAALMLYHIGYPDAATRIDNAVNTVLREGKVLTADIGGNSSTTEVTNAILKNI